ncbi:MAG: ABC transporter ATP-binding protein [Candidatus Vogelbacteria bacterium]|nr:ABC transporter ATP-binding protein [Candidatus Vogelbacteria bacterium]
MKEVLLQLKDALVNFGGVRALDDVSAEIDEGEIVAMLGPNGAGKSTVLKSIFGLVPLTRGEIRWHGELIQPRPEEMARRGIAFVPQGRRVFAHLSVLENLEVGGFVVRDRRIIKERIGEVLEFFPLLRARLAAKAGLLSGGGQQMLAIARGLMPDPKVLLLDEPSLGLAPLLVKEIFKLIREINERRRTAIIVVEHNIKSLLEVAHRAYVLEQGRVTFAGRAADLLRGPTLERVLMGAAIAA